MPIVLKSGSLNLLEPSGPVQACNGIALPFTNMFVHTVGGIVLQNQPWLCSSSAFAIIAVSVNLNVVQDTVNAG